MPLVGSTYQLITGVFFFNHAAVFSSIKGTMWYNVYQVNPGTSLIAWFMGPTWGPSGAAGPRWVTCWPLELCYLDYWGNSSPYKFLVNGIPCKDSCRHLILAYTAVYIDKSFLLIQEAPCQFNSVVTRYAIHACLVLGYIPEYIGPNNRSRIETL